MLTYSLIWKGLTGVLPVAIHVHRPHLSLSYHNLESYKTKLGTFIIT